MRYVGDGRPWDREFAARRHRDLLAHWKEHGFGWRAILGRDDGAFLGVAALNRCDWAVPGVDQSALEIGWWVDPGAWGRGIATEAATAIRDEAFTRLGAEGLVARFQPANAASGRIMIKIGMSLYGDIVGGVGEPVRVYTLGRADWVSA